MNRIKIFVILCACILLAGCASEKSGEETDYREYSVEDVSLFISAEDSPVFGVPSTIKASFGGLYLVDTGLFQIHKADRAGDLQLSFGNRGDGPGEFRSIAGFWPLGNSYLVYDYNSFKFVTFDLNGDMTDEVILRENPVNPESQRSIPITVEALSSDILLIPTGGHEGSLFAIVELGGGKVTYAGNALGEFVARYDTEEVTQAYSRGEIPGILKNLVMLGGSSSGIYSLQQTTGVLEKFNHSGERVWGIELNVPGQEGLLVQIAQKNREAVRRNEHPQIFMYAQAMDVSEEGVAMLLNMPENLPATVAWVPADGSGVDLVTIEALDLHEFGFMGTFSLSTEDRMAYILERETGTVYQFEWPL